MYSSGDVRVEDVPDPTITAPTDALVRVTHACVCGSDLHPYHDLEETPGGRRMGHEAIGVVEEVGFFDGAASATQAELLLVPYADGTAVVIPAGTDESLMPSLLTLSDVYLTGYHAARLLDIG